MKHYFYHLCMVVGIANLLACSQHEEPELTTDDNQTSTSVEPNTKWKLVMESDPVQTIWDGVQQYAEFDITVQAPDTLSSEKICEVSVLGKDIVSSLYFAGLFSTIQPRNEIGTSTTGTLHGLDIDEIKIYVGDEVIDASKPFQLNLGGEYGTKATIKAQVPAFYCGVPESPAQYTKIIVGALQISAVENEKSENIDLIPCLFMIQHFKPSVLINSTNSYYAEIATAIPESEEVIVNVPLKVFGYNPNPNGISLTVLCNSSTKGVKVSVDENLEIPSGELQFELPVTFNLSSADITSEFRASAALRIVVRGKEDELGTTPEINVQTTTGTVALCISSPYRLEVDPDKMSSNDMETTEGSFAGLVDDNPLSFFHSSWTTIVERSEPYGSYIDMELPKTVDHIAMELTARGDNTPVSPKIVSVYYSLTGADDAWEPLILNYTLDLTSKSEKAWIGGIEENEWIVSPEKFKYLRFCVLTNSNNESLCVPNTKTSHYWNLAELHIFGK